MRLVLVLLALAACQPEPKDFPRVPGGGGGGSGAGSGSGSGSGSGDDVDASGLAGRVCLVTDLRQLDQCATSGAGNFTVTLGTEVTTTEDDGTFTITQPAGLSLVWRVTGTGVTSVMAFTTTNVIPAIAGNAYQSLLDGNGIILSPNQGSIVVSVLDSGVAVADALVGAAPVPQFPTRYDGNSATLWDSDQTGVFGIAWITGVPVGQSTVTVTPPSPNTPQSVALGVENAAITFATFGL